MILTTKAINLNNITKVKSDHKALQVCIESRVIYIHRFGGISGKMSHYELMLKQVEKDGLHNLIIDTQSANKKDNKRSRTAFFDDAIIHDFTDEHQKNVWQYKHPKKNIKLFAHGGRSSLQ